MNLWELRQLIETSIPWYGPIVFGILFIALYALYVTLGEPVICKARKNRAIQTRIGRIKNDLKYLNENSHLTDETKAKIRLRMLASIRRLEQKLIG